MKTYLVKYTMEVVEEIEAENEAGAKAKVDEACKKLLCNQIMEGYEFKLSSVK